VLDRRTTVALLAIVAGLAMAVPASAGPPPDLFDNQYQGKAERDPQTYVGFVVIRRNGKSKVGRVTGLLPFNCVDGISGRVYARARGKLPVDDGGRFSGKVVADNFLARGADQEVTYEFAGRLGKRGRARGTIDGVLTFQPTRGLETVRCYTGELDWRARRGADAGPVSR
jgi:hypothetical protein